jgi:enediyne biosynthesis protein E4
LRLHFGLSSVAKIDWVEVRWPTGKTENFKDVVADKIYTITEGQGIKATSSLPAPNSLAF